MLKFCAFGFLLLLSACEMVNEPEPLRQVPAVVEPYIQRFISEAAARGHSVPIDQIVVVFESPISELDHPTATCSNGPELSAPLIKLDTTLSWWRLGEMAREEVIFHELGHCILNRSHKNDLLINGDQASLMRAESPLLYLFIESVDINITFKRDYYLDELFDPSVASPCWEEPNQVTQSNVILVEDDKFGFRNLVVDGQNQIWASDFNRLARYDGLDQFVTVDSGSANFVNGTGNGITLDGQGSLWVAKENNGFTTIWKQIGNQMFELASDAFPFTGFRGLDFDGEGNLYMAGANGQVAFMPKGDNQLTIFNAENSSLPFGFVSGLVGSNTKGAYFAINNQLVWDAGDHEFSVISENSTFPGGGIRALSLDHDNNLWVAQGGKLFQLRDDQTFKAHNMIDLNLPYSQINTMVFDEDGDMWLGTTMGLRLWQKGKRFSNYCQYFLGQDHNNIGSIAFDQNGNVWAKSTLISRQTIIKN